jgi:hypothetical protein
MIDARIIDYFGKTAWFEMIAENNVSKGIVTPDGVLGEFNGGQKSGRYDTSFKGTLINRMLYEFTVRWFGLPGIGWMGNGDDGVWSYSEPVDIDQLSKELESTTGFKLNAEKSKASDSFISYLQRIHSMSYLVDGLARGVRSIFRTVNHMKRLERKRRGWSEEAYSLAWLMQAENLWPHQYWERLVTDWFDKDYVIQQRDFTDIVRAAGGVDTVEGVLNIAGYRFARPDLRGLEAFKTVRLVRSLRSQSRSARGATA